MFWLLESRANTALLPLLFLTPCPTGINVEGKVLWGSTAGPGDHTLSKEYSRPYNVMLCNKIWGCSFDQLVFAQRLAGHQSVCERIWVIAFAGLLGFFSSLFPSLIKLSITGPTSFFHFCSSYSVPYHTTRKGISEWLYWIIVFTLFQLKKNPKNGCLKK